MIISTAVSEVVVISQIFYRHFIVSDIKKNIRTICLKLKEYSNTKINIRLSLNSDMIKV